MCQFITLISTSAGVGFKVCFIFLLATDQPKHPDPVVLEQVVYGKIIFTRTPSPDQEKDDRLHYMVAERDSNTHAGADLPIRQR